MTYIVNGWFGRYGNCIQQVMNGLLLAEYHKTKFIQNGDHNIISKFELSFGNEQQEVNYGRYFFWNDWYNTTTRTITSPKDFDLPEDYITTNARRICKTYIKPHLNLDIQDPFDDDTLVIHLRSGDVYHHFHNPNNYVPNPWIFYLKLIEKFDKIIVVTENDRLNPFISEFEKLNKVEIQSTTVENDVATLMRSKHLALSGVGTFAVAAGLCSLNITNLYCTNLKCNEHLNYTMFYNTDVKVNEMILKDYIKVNSIDNPDEGWINSEEQREFIMTYGLK